MDLRLFDGEGESILKTPLKLRSREVNNLSQAALPNSAGFGAAKRNSISQGHWERRKEAQENPSLSVNSHIPR